MMNKRFYILGLVLLLIIPALLPTFGCGDETSAVELGEAVQGRYTIVGEDGIVAYLDLSDGRYSVIPIEDSEKPLEELDIDFFGENPEGTYTIHYFDGIFEKTTREDLDENLITILGSIVFASSAIGHLGESDIRSLDYHRPNEIIYINYFVSTLDLHPECIWKPWE